MNQRLSDLPFVQNPRPELALVTDWYVDGVNGSDDYDGQSAANTPGPHEAVPQRAENGV